MTALGNSIEHLHDVLAHIQHLSSQSSTGGNPSKHHQIRVAHWVRKLRSQPTSNPTWLKSVLEYANVLLYMLLEGALDEPFTKMPPQGPLAALPRHQVARLARPTRQLTLSSRKTQRAQRTGRQVSNNANNVDLLPVPIRKATKQIQTQEQDDQWEWQRVWKGAFAELRLQLQSKTAEADALATENKELRALSAGHQKALEEAERDRRDVNMKHQAELDNLRAVHALELSDLQRRHRRQIQEASMQHSEAGRQPVDSGDFLQYIDAFYSATKQLTAHNRV